MHAPQVIVLIWFAVRVACGAFMHGQPIAKPTTVINGLAIWVQVAVGAGILFWGGFWDPR